jgi:hypothetical protein
MTAMQRVITRLLADQTITPQRNGSEYPVQTIEIIPSQLLSGFAYILKPLVYAEHRALSVSTDTNAPDIVILNAIISSVAYDAVLACHSVLWHKLGKLGGTYRTLLQGNPVSDAITFPAYLTALISSIGPHTTANNAPYRTTIVPYVSLDAITAVRPTAYRASAFQKLNNALTRNRSIALTVVDVNTSTNSPWWINIPKLTTSGRATLIRVYSPLPYEETDSLSRTAMIFFDRPIVAYPGFCNYSACPDEVKNREPISINDFDDAFTQPPYFNPYAPAYDYIIQVVEPLDDGDVYHDISHLTVDSPLRTFVNRDSEKSYRFIWIYHDHYSVSDFNINRRATLSTSLNSV